MTIETRKYSASGGVSKQLVVSKDEMKDIIERALKAATKTLIERSEKLEQEIVAVRPT